MAGSSSPTGADSPHSQTLDRGIRALELLAQADRPLSIAELGELLGVHRSIVYRIVRTLEDHHLVTRGPDGRLLLGTGLAVLSSSVRPILQTAALPELSDLANGLGMTSFLVVREGDEAVTVQSVEPRHSTVHVVYRPGVRHPVDRGAPGLALLAGLAPVAGERAEVRDARARGWVTSRGEVLPGMRAIASPIVDARGGVAGAVSVVYVESPHSTKQIGARVVSSAAAIAREIP